MNGHEMDTGTDHEDILKHYEVESNQDMTIEQILDIVLADLGIKKN